MFTFVEDLVSDLHKDAYGFRPSEYWWAIWSESTLEQKQGTWDDLIDVLRMKREYEAAALDMHERMHEIFGALHAQNTVNNSQD